LRATLSSGASIDGWHALIAAPPARHEWHHRLLGDKPQAALEKASGAKDAAAVEGAHPPYLIPNLAVDHASIDVTLPTGRWRGQAYGATIFFTECFVDELAGVSGVDPFTFRMGMLGDRPALARCLETATALGGWEGGHAGSGQGVACCSLRGSHIAVMAVARPGAAGLIVDRLVAAVDAGRILNPAIVRQQIEGGLLFGLAAAVGATTRYVRGLARARRLRDLGLPRLAQMPAVEIELIDSDRAAGGYEELGVPPVAPAIANALFTMTGERIRRLPLSMKPLP
jgi:isoquinoline 1-oxidoreductase beta subunit